MSSTVMTILGCVGGGISFLLGSGKLETVANGAAPAVELILGTLSAMLSIFLGKTNQGTSN